MAIQHLGRVVIYADTQANVEADAGALTEIVYAVDTDTDVLGFSIDNGTTWVWLGTGTVTSVALSAAPSGIFDVSGSPVTTSGTLALSLDTQSANTFLGGPTSGAAATPSFRTIAASHLSTRYEPVTNGDTGTPELIFHNGDVIVAEVS